MSYQDSMRRVMQAVVVATLILSACAPAAPPSPTAPAAKPAPTTAPAKPTEAPAAKPAEKPAETKPAASPAAKPAEAKPAASPAAKPAEAKPAASPQPAAKPAPFDEKAVADFYRGKTVRIVVGFPPGGGFDYYARLLSRHMGKYIPGNPNIIIENKPGAASLLAANLAYNSDPKDGTVLVTFQQNLVIRQAVGAQGIEFDAAKFNWLGSSIKAPVACVARADSGVTSIQDTIQGKELITATTGNGTDAHDVPAIINEALGTRFKLVPGYDGSPRMKLAIESKEVQAFCVQFDYFAGAGQSLVEGPSAPAKAIVVMGATVPDLPFLKGVPTAESLAKTDEAKLLLKAVNAPAEITFPFATPPGVPVDRVAMLRKAVASAFADPELIDEAKKAGRSVIPTAGEEVSQIVQSVLSPPPAVLAKLKEILK